MTTPHKLYPPITGLRGDCGENEATLVATAILNPSHHYPDCGRIIVGSPASCLAAGEADIGAWSSGPEAAVRVAETLLEAVADVDAAIDAAPPLAFRYRTEELGVVIPPAVYELSNGRCDSCCAAIAEGARTLAYWECNAAGARVALLHAERCPTRCSALATRPIPDPDTPGGVLYEMSLCPRDAVSTAEDGTGRCERHQESSNG